MKVILLHGLAANRFTWDAGDDDGNFAAKLAAAVCLVGFILTSVLTPLR